MKRNKSVQQKLNKIMANVAKYAHDHRELLVNGKAEFFIKDLLVVKGQHGYNIFNNYGDKLYENLVLLEAAIYIAKQYEAKKYTKVIEMTRIEKTYAKYTHDMHNYLHSYNSAKAANDNTTMAVMEDRYYDARQSSKHYKRKIKQLSIQK